MKWKKWRKSVFLFLLLNGVAFALWWLAKDRYSFDDPWVFYFLFIVPLLSLYWILRNGRNTPTIKVSIDPSQLGSSLWSTILGTSMFLFRIVAIVLLLLALARPQSETNWQDVSTEGIDIVLTLDVSASMLARDFKPNRLESSKKVAAQFITARPNDRIGLVIYESEGFTQCPLTTDHRILLQLFNEIESGWIGGGTAIGMGLATSVNRLRQSDAKSKVIILLTDGVNNAGSIPPMTAAEIAAAYDIRVYTIGVGSIGKALSPVTIDRQGNYQYDYIDVQIDEKTLKEIASRTGGEYFRAANEKALQEIYATIDRLEKTKIKVTEHSQKEEEFFAFAAIGMSLLLLEFFVGKLLFNRVP